ncbi:MAG: DUF2169 domain-containing protein [Polyangiaceae bacterium]|nr:DUF2169 domain-containing protein [Polyangiaceae bacterium]MCW5791901.1 DUF2169 domain-containing protein [Polyangiaceae bacterium]
MFLPLPKRPRERVPAITDSALSVATFPWRFRPGEDSLVVVAKLSLELRPGRVATPLDESALLSGEAHWDGLTTASLRSGGDLAPLKLRADVWVSGHAHPEPGATTSPLGLSFGALQRSGAVIGERRWDGVGITLPQPMRAPVPLRYERAFGGQGYAPNPVGRGFGPGARLLPSLEDPATLIRDPSDRPAPWCPAPIASTWAPRAKLLGSYGDAWLKRHWPYFPEDFDYAYFNAAPAAQQLAAVRGDERFALTGMHPSHPRLEGKLPGLVARAFAQTTEAHGLRFTEVKLTLDTVAFEPDELLVHLVFRGSIQVSQELAPELATVYVTLDDLAQPASVTDCRERFVSKLAHLEPEVGALPQLRFGLRDPSTEQARREQAKQAAKRIPLQDAKPSRAPVAPTRDRAAVEALIQSGEPLVCAELSGCDLHGLDLRGRDLSAARLSQANLSSALLEGARLSGAVLLAARLEGADLRGAHADGANLAEAKLAGADLTGANLAHATLSEASGAARFDEATLAGADLSDARLDHASFDRADLRGASLYAASLRQASFKGADLTDAMAYEAELSGACLDGADLTRLRADEARLDDASIATARAEGASFLEASLSRASLSGTRLDDAVLNHARLDQANLARARLPRARLRHASLRGASLLGASLMEANLERADLTGADLRGASLYGAETLGAKLEEARLEQADLTATKLCHPLLKAR